MCHPSVGCNQHEAVFAVVAVGRLFVRPAVRVHDSGVLTPWRALDRFGRRQRQAEVKQDAGGGGRDLDTVAANLLRTAMDDHAHAGQDGGSRRS
ncbi:MAG: hypothetical protein HY360_07145 [Verrucomicrobia bacterium]|nr:hypothetical protein [Verrucomicrobiota bacterium]